MSDQPDSTEPGPAGPVPLAVFAASLRPRQTGSRTLFPRAGQRVGNPHVINTFSPGSPDEIWIKLLTVNHGMERHSPAEWQALIDEYKTAPAHPADPHYTTGA